MPDLTDLLNKVHTLDCFDLLARIPDGTIDAIITDLPYGTTACSWDTVIPFAPMWAEVKRVLKPRGVFVTTASQPFTSALVMSNPAWFKYSWVWDKVRGVGLMAAQYRPMMQHEDVLVFCEGSTSYYPIMTPQPFRTGRVYSLSFSNPIGNPDDKIREYDCLYPKSILRFSNADQTGKQHPTQKPLNLFEYLIKTYTQPGELVLDFCAGSGTTAVACRNTGRRFIAGDKEAEYVAIARDRLRMPFEPREHVKESAPMSDLPLFAAIGD